MFNSVRIKLTLWFTGVLAVLLILFAVLTYFLFAETSSRQTDKTLSDLNAGFQGSVKRELESGAETESDENKSQRNANETEFNNAVNEAADDYRLLDYQIFVFDSRRNAVIETPVSALNVQNHDVTENMRNALPDFLARLDSSSIEPVFSTIWIERKPFRVNVQTFANGRETYIVLVAHSLEEQYNLLRRVAFALFVAVPTSLIVASAGGYFLAKKSLSPVSEMNRRATRINAENLSMRLPVKNANDELGALATTFNDLLTRLDESFANQRRFMADASHELRTPLAIVRGESEIALSKPERAAKDYRESLEIVFDESKRMSRIVEDLFTLARVDAGQLRLRKTEISLDELTKDCVRAVRVLALEKQIEISSRIETEMFSIGDAELLRRMLLNLLDNAIKYNSKNGTLEIIAKRENGFHKITIENTGNEIHESAKAQIFERFFRGDAARTRVETHEGSGAGLGLSIAKWIAEAHAGTIRLIKSDSQSTVFELKFPEVSSVLN